MRSSWKNDIVFRLSPDRKVFSYSSKIKSDMVGSSLYFYNGRQSKLLNVGLEHIGFKCGEFCFTKRFGMSIHSDLKPRRNKRMFKKIRFRKKK